MPTCYLGLGSNLKFPKRQLRMAIQSIKRNKNIYIKSISSFYFSKPIGIKSQPMYYNLVMKVESNLAAHSLLLELKKIETKQNRITKIRWGSRTIDIDILLYGNKKINTRLLKIPHPEMYNREFVLVPLAEVYENIAY